MAEIYGTRFAEISGNYSTVYIATYELLGQSSELSESYFRLRGYFQYNGGTSVESSGTYDGFRLDGVQLNNGNYRFYPGTHLLGEFDITVKHDDAGNWPGRTVGISAYSYQFSDATEGYLWAPNIARKADVTGATDFNDETNPTITYTNPGGFRINARLEFAGTYINRPNIPNTGTYKFELTESERKLLRQKCTSNSLPVREVIATCYDGTNESAWDWEDKTMYLINYEPVFNNFIFEDVNEKTLEITGNNQNIVKGFSNVKVTIPLADKAVARKEATMKNYRFTCGNDGVPIDYKDDADTSNTMHLVPNGIFTVHAIDSRGYSTPVERLANEVIDYTPLKKTSIDVYRSGGVSEEVNLKIEGTIHELNFGVKENSITYSAYKYRVAGTEEWSAFHPITLNIENGKFSYDGIIQGDLESKGFNISNSYEVQVFVSDELSTVDFTDTFGSGTPNIAYHKNGISVMGKYDVEEGGAFQVQGKRIDYNLKTDGEPVKCGYRVDGKDVYVKRCSTGYLPNSTTSKVNTGLDFTAIKIVKPIEGNGYRSAGDVINIPMTNASGFINVFVLFSEATDGLVTIAASFDRSEFSGYIDIYFTYRD